MKQNLTKFIPNKTLIYSLKVFYHNFNECLNKDTCQIKIDSFPNLKLICANQRMWINFYVKKRICSTYFKFHKPKFMESVYKAKGL